MYFIKSVIRYSGTWRITLFYFDFSKLTVCYKVPILVTRVKRSQSWKRRRKRKSNRRHFSWRHLMKNLFLKIFSTWSKESDKNFSRLKSRAQPLTVHQDPRQTKLQARVTSNQKKVHPSFASWKRLMWQPRRPHPSSTQLWRQWNQQIRLSLESGSGGRCFHSRPFAKTVARLRCTKTASDWLRLFTKVTHL